MKSCVFRCLTEQDYYILSSFHFIPCGFSEEFNGKYLYNGYKLGSVLDTVNRHLTNGSKFYSSWISCSKNFITDIEKYSLSTKTYETNYRPYIAVIRHHNQTAFHMEYSTSELEEIIHDTGIDKVEDLYREFRINKIRKLVLNVSNTDDMLKLFQCGLLRNYDGTKSLGGSMALNFAKASDEVLVFRDIPVVPKDGKYSGRMFDQLNIPVILSPLAYDVLYSLIKRGSITEDDSYYIMYYINNFVNDKNNFYDLLTENEKDFFRLYYSNRYQMRTILKLIDSNTIDYASLFYEFNMLKINILKKVITRYNEKKGTNYCMEPYFFYSLDEMVENNDCCCDTNLSLGRSQMLIKSHNWQK